MDIDDIAHQARQCIAAARFDQARLFYLQWLARDAQAVEPLRFLGRLALANGRIDRAIGYLEQLRDVDAGESATLRDLGVAYRRAQRLDEAESLLGEALLIDASDAIARLHLGAVHEALDRPHDALVAYFSAVSTSQGRGEWRAYDSTPPTLRGLVEHAINIIERDRPLLFDKAIAPLRARYGRDSLARVERCLAMYLQQLPTTYADPRQKPTFLYFPDLPATPWFPRELFPWYEILEDQWQAIREECLAVMADGGGVVPFMEKPFNIQGLPYIGGPSAQPQWNAYFFHRHGKRHDDHCLRCPVTAAALDAVPIVRIRDHAPECLYSVLTAGSAILSHRGVTNTRTVTHLPLIVPGNGALRVAGEDREWQAGRCFSFDDTFLHEAWNHSDSTRAILLLDCWNPYLTDVERLAIAELVAAIGDFSRETRVALPGDSEERAGTDRQLA